MRTLSIAEARRPITVGSMADFADAPLEFMRRLHAEHGDVAALESDTDGRRVHFAFSPEFNRQILADGQRFHSIFFAMRGGKRSAQRRVSSGLLSMNGAEHKHDRRIVMDPFKLSNLSRYHDDVIAVSDSLIDSWAGAEQPGGIERDVNADMTSYMLRLTCTILFGLANEELAYKVGELTEEWVALNHDVGIAAYVPNGDHMDRYEALLESAVHLEDALKEMIAARREAGFGRDVLSLLIQARDAGHLNDTRLFGHIALLFGAAHLTSAHTLTWTLLMLAQNPGVREKLDDEFEAVLGDGSGEQVLGNRREITQEDLPKLTYLDMVLKESMRVLPASCYLGRFAAEETELGPFSLRPGDAVVFSQFMTQHRADVFEDPHSFRPERWETVKPTPYEYLPFGGGARRCIGASLGMMQFQISLPRILSKYKFTSVAGSTVDYQAHSTMLHPASPVRMRIESNDGHYEARPVVGSIHSLVDVPGSAAGEIRRSA